jgi:hypothetical protein
MTLPAFIVEISRAREYLENDSPSQGLDTAPTFIVKNAETMLEQDLALLLIELTQSAKEQRSEPPSFARKRKYKQKDILRR